MTEAELQQNVADYLRLEYPDVLFHSDYGSGVKLTKGQAVKQKRQNGGRRGWPDIFIAEPREAMFPHRPGAIKTPIMIQHGLFLEFKKEGETLYPGQRAKKRFKSIDGKEYKSEHLMEQADICHQLRKAGYAAEFAIGFDEAKKTIDSYLKGARINGR